jgi:hypothetical protein
MKFNPAKILVQDYLELNSMTLGLSEWTEEHFRDNPPRLLRLQRIRACLSCLEIEVADFYEFEDGDWVKPVSEDLLETILLVLKTPFELDYEQYIRPEDRYSERYHFGKFLSIRVALYKLSSIRKSVLAASGHFLTPVLALRHLEKKVEAECLALDEVLQLLLNPEELRVELKTMVTDFGFPDVDMDEVDLDWI